MIYQKLLGAPALRPIPIWACGRIDVPGGGVDQSFVLYKPVHGDWQLQYVSAEPSFAPNFTKLFRRKSDPEGKLWAGIYYRPTSAAHSTDNACCAVSLDHGVTWTKRFYDNSGMISDVNGLAASIFVPVDDVPCVHLLQSGALYLLRWDGAVMRNITGYPSGRDRFGGSLGVWCLEEDQSPTGSPILKVANGTVSAGLGPIEIWRSDDLGENWTIESTLNPGSGAAGVDVTADVKQFVMSSVRIVSGSYVSDYWSSDDSLNWTRKDVGTGANNSGNSGLGARSARRIFIGGGVATPGGGADGPSFRSTDGGDSWVQGTRVFRRVRHLGNALYGITANSILRSNNMGTTWTDELLPDLTGLGGTVTLQDING